MIKNPLKSFRKGYIFALQASSMKCFIVAQQRAATQQRRSTGRRLTNERKDLSHLICLAVVQITLAISTAESASKPFGHNESSLELSTGCPSSDRDNLFDQGIGLLTLLQVSGSKAFAVTLC